MVAVHDAPSRAVTKALKEKENAEAMVVVENVPSKAVKKETSEVDFATFMVVLKFVTNRDAIRKIEVAVNV